ncbi:kinase-like protein [Pholiota conissans]|uniref:non-specific serine/threonine protein kinase n=1 Tax=Pholiota conissans TaxID=109636 RepID=A0A9P6CMJ2_9AGAR|nr:kinase-like protein [Pholiota conissans]
MSKFLSGLWNALRGRPTEPRNQALTPSAPLSIIIRHNDNSEPQYRYEPGGYHLLRPGEVYNQRYEVIRKLGWGSYSTVWLVKDKRDQSLAAMKVLVGDMTIADKKGDWDELGMLSVIRDTNPQSQGYRHIYQLIDNFVHEGPNGNHVCLVLEAMHLSVLDVYRAFPGAMPLLLLKRICKHILFALRYLHEECGIIHTDLKGDNILLSGSPLEKEQLDIAVNDDYLMSKTFKLSDFGAANMMSNRFAQVIQPEILRSPEVIIGADWDTKTDIWNLGCIIYEFARGSKLFDPYWDTDNSGMSPTETHLSQMAGLCGEFPPEFLASCRKSNTYFDDQGSLLRGAGRYSVTLENLLGRAGHPPMEIREVAAFLSLMLTINPKERWSATQLLDHPWLRSVEE